MNSSKGEKAITRFRLNMLVAGCAALILFLVSTVIASVWLVFRIGELGFLGAIATLWSSALLIVLCESALFWAGIITVYLTSAQLGIKLRLIGILCGWIPVVNLIVLLIIIGTGINEAKFEKKKLKLDDARKAEQICQTKYPLLMVHGVFFRDFKYFNYWGRIPAELEKNGAVIYYGNHQSAASVADSAKELADRIKEIVETTGCEKVNIIAHSKGGLDTKTAVAKYGVAPYVASLTTVNTPHRGCKFADYLLEKVPAGVKDKMAATYNAALRRMGDTNPDFIAAVTDLTAANCQKIAEEVDGFDFSGNGIYTRSVGSCMKWASGGAFPLNMSYHFVGRFDGRNDGLVGEESFKWGQDYTFLENKYDKGISHGDMIDLNRANIRGFDVREFYVGLVADLKKKGL